MVADRDYIGCIEELEQAKKVIERSCIYIALAEFPEDAMDPTVRFGQMMNRDIDNLIERLRKADDKFGKEEKE